MPKHRVVPDNAVMSNTVEERMKRLAAYKPLNLTKPIDDYHQATVIPPAEM